MCIEKEVVQSFPEFTRRTSELVIVCLVSIFFCYCSIKTINPHVNKLLALFRNVENISLFHFYKFFYYNYNYNLCFMDIKKNWRWSKIYSLSHGYGRSFHNTSSNYGCSFHNTSSALALSVDNLTYVIKCDPRQTLEWIRSWKEIISTETPCGMRN